MPTYTAIARGRHWPRGASGGRVVVEVDALLFDHQRTIADWSIDRPDLLAEDSEDEQLHGGDAEEPDDDRRDADRQVGPERQLHHEVDQGGRQAPDRADQA